MSLTRSPGCHDDALNAVGLEESASSTPTWEPVRNGLAVDTGKPRQLLDAAAQAGTLS
jgi:hypothetical protein